MFAATLLVLTVSACSAPATQDATSLKCPRYTEGGNVSKVQVTGEANSVPKVDFTAPIDSEIIETKVIKEGTGTTFIGDSFIDFDFLAVNGATGKVLTASAFNGKDFGSQMIAAGGYPDFCHGLSGIKEGSRVAMLFPASLSHNSQPSQDGSLAAKDSILYVLDLKKVYPNKADGAEQPAPDGFPVVVRAADGTPGLTQLKTVAPSEFKLATLIKGSGAVVQENQKVTVQYSGFVWGGDKFDSSWDRQSPSQFQLSKGAVIDGFVKAIAGQTIGSQVIAIIPPAEGYGDQEQSGIPANSTLIFVIDILGAN